MTPDELGALRALNDVEHRRFVQIPGYRTESAAMSTRCLSPSGQAYAFWQAATDDIYSLVKAEIAWHRHRARRLTWKVYEHDSTPATEAALRAYGFACEGPPNRCAGLQLNNQHINVCLRRGYTCSRLNRAAELDELISLYDQIWPNEDNGLWLSGYREALARGDDGLHLMVTRNENRQVVASGGLIHAANQAIGHLFGGGTLSSHRQQGLYKYLVALRAELLWRRGGRWLVVDAGEESWPILQALGFLEFSRVSFWSLAF